MTAQLNVDGGEALANRRCQRPFQGDTVFLDGIQRCLRHQRAVLLERDQSRIDKLIGQPALEGLQHLQGGVHDFGADAVAFDHCYCLAHVRILS